MSIPLPTITSEDVDALFKLLIDSVPIGVAVIDPDLRLRYNRKRHASRMVY